MGVLLLAELNGADLALDATAKAVTAAKPLGEVLHLAVLKPRMRWQKLMVFQGFLWQTMQFMKMVLQSQSLIS